MGCNAVRTSHNVPTPEWVEGCDRMGMMMMCETRQMSSSPEGMAQLEAMVKRYRNSPSIILWSIGNEEGQLQGAYGRAGRKIGATMVQRCHELDPTRVVSAAVNGDNKKGVSDAFDIIGFNYGLESPRRISQDSIPRRPIYGSETSSAISTRGDYTTDPLRNTINAYDGVVPLGETAEEWWKFYGTREWEAGGFAWTGFDYRGEPTPYGWPSINSQFGIVDMCGFPKDYFYYYKAWWRTEPALHLFPHWNFVGREGDIIPVWVYSNCDEVELIANGKTQGRQKCRTLATSSGRSATSPAPLKRAASRPAGWCSLRSTKPPAPLRPSGSPLTALRSMPTAKTSPSSRSKPSTRKAVRCQPPPTSSASKSQAQGASSAWAMAIRTASRATKSRSAPFSMVWRRPSVQSNKQPGEIHIEAAKEGWEGPVLTPAKLVITTRKVEPRPAVPERRDA